MQQRLLRHLYQNDQVFEVLGHYTQSANLKKVFLMAPNYQTGGEALNGFKKDFKGEIADELNVPLGTLDYSAELTRIAAARPDAVFVFLPAEWGSSNSSRHRGSLVFCFYPKVICDWGGNLRTILASGGKRCRSSLD
jgi:hypothetical protein